MKESTSDLYLAAFLQMKGLKPKAINHLGWLVDMKRSTNHMHAKS